MLVPRKKKSKPACNAGGVSAVAQAHITDRQPKKHSSSPLYLDPFV